MANKHQRQSSQSWFDLFRHHGGWAVMLGAVVLVVLTAISIRHYVRDQAFVNRAIPVQAELRAVDHLAFLKDGQISVRLQVDGPNGQFEQDVPIDWLMHARMEVGDVVSLYYVQTTPPQLTFTLPDPATRGWAYQFAAGFVGLVTLGFGGFAAVRTTDAMRARRYGPMIKAVVFGKEAVMRVGWEWFILDKEDGGFWEVFVASDKSRLVFVDRDGRMSRSLPHSNADLAAFNRGDEIDVYRGVRRSWWYNDLGPRRDLNSDIPAVKTRKSEA